VIESDIFYISMVFFYFGSAIAQKQYQIIDTEDHHL